MSKDQRGRGSIRHRMVAVVAGAVLAVAGSPLVATPASASSPPPSDFEAPDYAPGSVDGQQGWGAQGLAIPVNPNLDQEVVTNVDAPPSFGAQSWRFSNAFTQGSFGDQVFSPSAPDEAGEPSADAGGLSGGTRQTRFTAQWDFSSANPGAEQTGLGITASPDRGDGARMSWVRMEDHADGLAVLFNDFQKGDDPGCSGDFVQTEIASGLDRAAAHTVAIVMDFVDGAANDVVQVYVDGGLAHTGTSWEDYFRDCEGNPTRTVDSLLFRSSGTAAPATDGFGFLIDNLSIATETLAVPDAPTNLSATESASTVDLDWDAPAGDGGSPITGYTVYRDGSPIGTTDAVTTSFQDTTAPASSQAHAYKVTAENAVGSSADSNTDTAIVDLSWKGQVWDVVNGTAVVNGEGGVDLTRLSSGESYLHLVGDAPINENGTPWVRFDYQDDGTSWQGIDLFIDSEENPGDDPRISAGSLFSCDSLGYARHSIPAVEEIVYPADDSDCVGPRSATAHSLYVGERSDGTVDYEVDGDWHSTTFLKDFTGSFAFNDILLRWRCGATTPAPWVVPCAGGETVTFDDFAMGDDHHEDPPVVTITTPPDGVTYYNGLSVPADYACADASGIASCTGDVADGAPIDTSTDGEHDFTVTGVDNQGQETSVTHTYNVLTPAPALTITKAVDEPTAVAGATLHYHLTVTNAGNIPLTGLGVVDPNAPTCAGPIADLAVGASTTVDCTYATTTGDVGTRANVAAVMSAEFAFALSNIVTTTVTPALPGAPTGLTATEDGSVVDLAWTAPASNGGSPITGYDVYRDNALIHTTDGSTLSYQDTGATASSAAHTYEVRARNAAGAGAPSNTDTAIVDLTWKGEVWDVLNGTAVVNGDGGVDFTRLAAGQSWLHMVGTPDINADGTPWVEFSYTDDGTSYQGIDMFIDSMRVPDDPRLQAGSLFACGALGYARYNIPEVEQIVYPEDDQACVGPRPAEAHTVYAGERSDGTVDYIADGELHTTTFLKDATGPFAFNDVILRWRCGAGQQQPWVVPCAGGETVTFDDFTMGDDHDVVGPHITITTPVDGAVYELDDEVLADFTCVDDTALASCVGDVADGDPIDTSTEGEHEFTVTAEDEDGHETTLTHTYTVIVPDPALEVVKSADEEVVDLGETIHYHLAIENTGNVDLHDVDVTDTAAPDCGDDPVFDLAVGASAVVDCTYTPVAADVGEYPNTAQVDSDRTEPVDSNEVVVTVDEPLAVALSADEEHVIAGETIHYHLDLHNTSALTLTGIDIADPAVPDCAAQVVADLAPDEEVTVDCEYTPTNADAGTFENTATVDADQIDPVQSNQVDVEVEARAPAITLEKEAAETTVAAGSPIHYQLTATNTGNVPLTGIGIIDGNAPACAGPVADLAVGADVTVDCTFTPSNAHVGTRTNVAAVTTAEFAAALSNVVSTTVTPAPGQAAGTVTESGSGDPLADIWVVALRTDDFQLVGSDITDAQGDYSLTLPPGAYFLYLVDSSGDHTSGFFGAPDQVVVASEATVDVDPALDPTKGTVHGTVTDAGSGDPLPGAWAVAVGGTPFGPEQIVAVDGNGDYTLGPLPTGDHFVAWVDPTGAHSPRFAPDSPTIQQATPVAVEAGVAATSDGALPVATPPPGGSTLTGTVTEEGTGSPLAGVHVIALTAADYTMARGAVTDANGEYSLDVAAGDYKLEFVPSDGTHAMEWYDDLDLTGIADAVNATAPGVADADLPPLTGTITGTITDEETGDPLDGAWVMAIGPQGPAGGAIAGPDGSYTLSGLPAGDYHLVFVDGTGARQVEYWDGHPEFEGSDVLVVGGGASVTADAALAPPEPDA